MKKLFTMETQILLGRLLTRSGDQAWDFVIPFALLHVFPGKIQIAALYYLLIKIGGFLLTPWVGRWIDTNQRLRVVKAGVWIQFVAVLGGVVIFYVLDEAVHTGAPSDLWIATLFLLLSGVGILASLGSLITDISVGNDLAPTLVPAEKLTYFNSWLRRIDLGTEVGAPIVAGVLFSLSSVYSHHFGLFLIALWNMLSFAPEYLLLTNVIKKSGLKNKEVSSAKSWAELFYFNWKDSLTSPIFWLIFSYALLWLSVLSPHGVLLAGYLKDKMALPEAEIGVFRGLGAIFGLFSTLSFPVLVKKVGLIESSKVHLAFQALTLCVGIVAFSFGTSWSTYIFLSCILLSRIGLYGFSNGEFELRQRMIPEGKRGQLNSFSHLTTTLATLLLFGAGSVLSSTSDFKYLVYASLAAVLLANVVFLRWAKATEGGI
ncbi:MAG: ABC transporter substrate-binding protein [Bdellovibrio sp. ArHS]|uniref:ABC transporter substrate-binding protein n=1 Tax=Bdellovibrio sp. ArHS TaxID=1569284 RepID=UPI00058379C0|nr:ABC transporter substrate-binding protein [Bdellovibrio sp. ArHS]KHD88444.1 MAG: ABC transporter substrate-binding protein [Bdellovibrio sp. ArHS]